MGRAKKRREKKKKGDNERRIKRKKQITTTLEGERPRARNTYEGAQMGARNDDDF